jgi:hypothetical protein
MATITAKQEQDKKARVQKGVDAMKKPDKPEGTLRHISVRPAENGYTVGVDREMPPKKSEKGDKDSPASPSYYEPPKDHVFSGKDAKQQVLDHIGKHLD